jgi:hypothetical protein
MASGAAEALPAPVADALRARRVGGGETLVWREPKENGRARVIVSAPTADQLTDALRRLPASPTTTVSETAVVFASARDLRAVRRVAVAGIKGQQRRRGRTCQTAGRRRRARGARTRRL